MLPTSTVSWSKLFHLLTTLREKKYLLTSLTLCFFLILVYSKEKKCNQCIVWVYKKRPMTHVLRVSSRRILWRVRPRRSPKVRCPRQWTRPVRWWEIVLKPAPWPHERHSSVQPRTTSTLRHHRRTSPGMTDRRPPPSMNPSTQSSYTNPLYINNTQAV